MTARKTLTAKRVTEELTLTEHHAGPLYDPAAWARLTAPLEHYQVPVILTPAERAADDSYRDHLRARVHLDRADVRDWHAQAREAVFGPLDDWLLLHRPSDEAVDAAVLALVRPDMMP